jgi:hypothetical protein
MFLDNQTHSIELSFTESQPNNIYSSNKAKREAFTNPTFFRDALYIPPKEYRFVY